MHCTEIWKYTIEFVSSYL